MESDVKEERKQCRVNSLFACICWQLLLTVRTSDVLTVPRYFTNKCFFFCHEVSQHFRLFPVTPFVVVVKLNVLSCYEPKSCQNHVTTKAVCSFGRWHVNQHLGLNLSKPDSAIFSPVACLQVCGNNRMIHALLFFDCKAVCVGVQWLTDNDWWDWQLLFKWRSDIFNLENPKGCPQAVWMEIGNLSTFTHLWWRTLKHRFDH